MRLPFRRKNKQAGHIDGVVWLDNIGDSHIMLHLPSGELRLDQGRKQRFKADILDLPQVKALVDAGQVAVRN